MDTIAGITLDLLAEITVKYGALRAQYGEPAFKPHFEAWLTSKGTNEYNYSQAHNGWLARFRSDPTGQLEADFHRKVSQGTAAAHFGDVRDMSQDVLEGVTLDIYAQVAVQMSKPGADPEAVARQFGLQGIAHWQAANGAWMAAMSRDTSLRLSTQYGLLFQKHAGPAFQEQMRNQIAAQNTAAQERRESARAAPPPADLTNDQLIATLQSGTKREQWDATTELTRRYDRGNKADPEIQKCRAAIPYLIAMIERHDEDDTNRAEWAAKMLIDIGERNDDVKGAITRCKNRGEEALANLRLAFAPIADKAVPERLNMQMKIGGYESMIGEMKSILEGWSPHVQVAIAGASPVAMHAQQSFAPQAPKKKSGVPLILILGPIVALAIGGAIYLKMALSNSQDADAAAASASAAANAKTPAATAKPAPTPLKAAATAPKRTH
jgi:hypothetical protein